MTRTIEVSESPHPAVRYDLAPNLPRPLHRFCAVFVAAFSLYGFGASAQCPPVGPGLFADPPDYSNYMAVSAGSNLYWKPFTTPVLVNKAQAIPDDVIALTTSVFDWNDPSVIHSYQQVYEGLLTASEVNELRLSPIEAIRLVNADKILSRQPSTTDCPYVHRLVTPLKPSVIYSRYLSERETFLEALRAVRDTCGTVNSRECGLARDQLRGADEVFSNDSDRARVEDAVRIHAGAWINEPEFRKADALERFSEYRDRPWSYHASSSEDLLNPMSVDYSIPGRADVTQQLPIGAIVVSIAPDWLDYRLLASGTLLFPEERLPASLSVALSIPLYLVYLPPGVLSGSDTYTLLGLITTKLELRPASPPSDVLRSTTDEPKSSARQALASGRNTYLLQGESQWDDTSSDAPIRHVLGLLLQHDWSPDYLATRFEASSLIASLAIWNEYHRPNATAKARFTEQTEQQAFQVFLDNVYASVRLATLYPELLGRPWPCEAKLLVEATQVALTDITASEIGRAKAPEINHVADALLNCIAARSS
jgi:hypothetical protein